MKNIIAAFFLLSAALLAGGNTRGVISLSPAMTELIVYLGGGDDLVARSTVCNYPEWVKKLPSAGDFGRPDLEKILAMCPQTMITNALVNPHTGQLLTQSGIKLVNIPCRDLKEYLNAVKEVSKAIGKGSAGEKETARTLALQKKYNAMPGCGKKVLIVVWDNPVMIAAGGTFLDEITLLAGGKNVISGNNGFVTPNLETLLTADFDAVLLCRRENTLKHHPVLGRHPAVMKNRVIDISGDIFNRPGPRWSEAVRILRQKLETSGK